MKEHPITWEQVGRIVVALIVTGVFGTFVYLTGSEIYDSLTYESRSLPIHCKEDVRSDIYDTSNDSTTTVPTDLWCEWPDGSAGFAHTVFRHQY